MISRLGHEESLHDRQSLTLRLVAAGWEPPAAAKKAALFDRVLAALEHRTPVRPEARPAVFSVPGRIEVLGKHTDYAGGRSMVAATECGFCLVAVPRNDAKVVVIDAARNDAVEFSLHADLVPTVGHWSNYPMTVARRIARNFPEAKRGATIALASDLPPAAGMSSSSALMVAVFFGLAELNGLAESDPFRANIRELTDLAGFLGTVENGQTFGSLVGDRGVGTFGGSEDHTAMLCSQSGRIGQFAYCPVRLERSIPVPREYAFAVAVSGVAAEKTGAAMEKYNAASRSAAWIADRWRRESGRTDPHLAAILGVRPDALAQLQRILRSSRHDEFDLASLLRRLEHFVVENEQILPAAGDALELGDLTEFGRLVAQSQQAAEELLGNQIPETSHLAHSACRHGAVAASAFGAGFGGSVWALVERDRMPAFLESWAESYRNRFPDGSQAAAFFSTAAGPAAFRVD